MNQGQFAERVDIGDAPGSGDKRETLIQLRVHLEFQRLESLENFQIEDILHETKPGVNIENY